MAAKDFSIEGAGAETLAFDLNDITGNLYLIRSVLAKHPADDNLWELVRLMVEKTGARCDEWNDRLGSGIVRGDLAAWMKLENVYDRTAISDD